MEQLRILMQRPAGFFIVAILVLDGLFLALAFGLIVVFRVRLLFRMRMRRGRVQAFQDLFQRYLAGEAAAEPALSRALPGLPLAAQASMFLKYSRAVTGEAHDAVVALFRGAGLPPWVSRLVRSRRWDNRLRAVRLLEVLGPDLAEAHLIRFLQDPMPLVRLQAFQMAPLFPTRAVVDIIFQRMRLRLPVTRFAIRDTLIRLGPATCERLHEFLTEDMDEATLVMAIEVAQGIRNPGCMPRLLHMLDTGTPGVQAAAARALSVFPSEQTRSALIRALDSEHDDIRAMAAWSLGQLMDPAAAEILEAAFADPCYDVRFHCAASLRRLGPAGREALARCRSHPDAFVRDMAAYVDGLPDFALAWSL